MASRARLERRLTRIYDDALRAPRPDRVAARGARRHPAQRSDAPRRRSAAASISRSRRSAGNLARLGRRAWSTSPTACGSPPRGAAAIAACHPSLAGGAAQAREGPSSQRRPPGATPARTIFPGPRTPNRRERNAIMHDAASHPTTPARRGRHHAHAAPARGLVLPRRLAGRDRQAERGTARRRSASAPPSCCRCCCSWPTAGSAAHSSARSSASSCRRSSPLQTFRIVGVVFVVAWVGGTLPAGFALPAGIGDVAIGLAAPFVAAAVVRRRPHHLALARIWNVLGVADLVIAVTSGVLHGRSPIGLLPGPVTTDVMARYPLSLIPTFLVPLALMLHLTTFRRLASTAVLRIHQPLGSDSDTSEPNRGRSRILCSSDRRRCLRSSSPVAPVERAGRARCRVGSVGHAAAGRSPTSAPGARPQADRAPSTIID